MMPGRGSPNFCTPYSIIILSWPARQNVAAQKTDIEKLSCHKLQKDYD
jgi:hypothetical protein